MLLTPFIVTGTDAGVRNEVRIFIDNSFPAVDGKYELESTRLYAGYEFHPFELFTGGVRVATGDFNGDGNDQLVVAAGPGGGPHVKIYDMTSDGLPGALTMSFFPFDIGFSGGLYVAAGDLDADGRDELIVSADAGGESRVRIFSDVRRDGVLVEVDSFLPFGNFGGGVRVAVGNVGGDGRDELIAGAGPGGSPHVRIYGSSDGDAQVSDEANGGLRDQFFAYGTNFTGGVYVASGSAAPNNRDVVITGPGAGGGPHVKVFFDKNFNNDL
ncbi:MAG: VCBS repeat-containing protein, partial [Planctomycetaceae bacterium]|nr:VCBS repeat-containing protein [Planctomycetaceae bacterium]